MNREDYENEIAALHLRERLRNAEVARLTAEVDRQRLQIEHMRADYTSRAGLHLRAEERAERLELELAAARWLLSIHSGQWVEDAARRAGEGER